MPFAATDDKATVSPNPARTPLLPAPVLALDAINAPVRGARLLLEAWVREGVDTIFGSPGGAVLHIYDELVHMAPRLRHVLARHEQGAIHVAEGYSKATGKVGVVLVTSGPGATTTVTGIANA